MFSKLVRKYWRSSRARTSSSSTSGSATCPASCSTSTCPLRRSTAPSSRTARCSTGPRSSRLPGDPRVGHAVLIPDVTIAYIDPFRVEKTLNINFHIVDPYTDEPYSAATRARSPRRPRRTSGRPASPTPPSSPPRPSSTSSTTCGSRPARTRRSTTSTRSRAPGTRAARRRQPGHKTPYKGGYFLVPPVDHFADLRDKISGSSSRRPRPAGRACPPRGRHRRPGRDQLPLRHARQVGRQGAMNKYVVKNVAHEAGKTATFMPKPSSATTGRACTCTSRSGRTASRCSSTRRATAAVLDTARWYIGARFKHAPALLAFTNPTVNSYHRLFRASRRRSTWSTRPATAPRASASRSPVRTRRPSASSSACRPVVEPAPRSRPCSWPQGLDGIQNRIEPPEPAHGRPLRACPRGARPHPAGPGLARRGARQPRGRPRLADRRQRLHAGPSSRRGSTTSAPPRDSDPSAAAPARVRAYFDVWPSRPLAAPRGR